MRFLSATETGSGPGAARQTDLPVFEVAGGAGRDSLWPRTREGIKRWDRYLEYQQTENVEIY